MEKAIKTLIYFVIGFFLLVFILFVINAFLSSSQKESAEVQYVEVTGKKGDVKLHIGMEKDSVQILVGKPDDVNIHSLGNTTFENWGYNLNKEYGTDLDIDFENGRLKGLRQY